MADIHQGRKNRTVYATSKSDVVGKRVTSLHCEIICDVAAIYLKMYNGEERKEK